MRLLLVLLAAVVGAAAACGGAGSSTELERASVATTTTTTTTTTPPLFPVLPEDGVNALRTPTGLVLPILGGGPGAWEVRTPCSNVAVVDGVPLGPAHVVLDPGHGGSEPGAVGPNGLVEKDVNLDVARRAATKLRADGAVVVLTRDTDIRVTLATRGELARSLQALAFVSIHHNAAPLGTATTPGSELYHQLVDPESRRLAGLLWEELQSHLAPFGTDWAIGDEPGARARQSATSADDFYGVLRNSQGVPAVLSEAGYLSHPPEAELLATDAFREAEARAIADAVVRLVGTDDPGSGFRETKVSSAPAGGGGGTAGCIDPPLA